MCTARDSRVHGGGKEIEKRGRKAAGGAVRRRRRAVFGRSDGGGGKKGRRTNAPRKRRTETYKKRAARKERVKGYIIRARVPYFFFPSSRKNPKWVLRGRRCGTALAVPITAALRSGTPGRPIAGRPGTRPLCRRRDAAGPTARPTRHAHRHWIPVDAVRFAGAHLRTHTHTLTHVLAIARTPSAALQFSSDQRYTVRKRLPVRTCRARYETKYTF